MRKNPTLTELSLAYLKLGITAYGAVMLQELKSSFLNRGWITEKEFREGLGMVQLYPGPVMFNLATYIAYKIRGLLGAVLGTFFFLLPTFLLIVLLSYLYFNYSKVEWLKSLFPPLEGMVLGIVVHVFIDFIGKFSNTIKKFLIATISFILVLLNVNGAFIVIVSFFLGIFLFSWIQGEEEFNFNKISLRWLRVILFGIPLMVSFLLGITFKNKLTELLYSMTKIGSIAFGNGFTILPLLQQEVVNYHHWVSLKEFTDGIAFGQITPGPILITATFIGYKVCGILGALIATFGIFYPSFFYTIVFTDIYEGIKELTFIKRGISAVLSSFTGMLAFVVLTIFHFLTFRPFSLMWTLYAFLLIRYGKLGVLPIFFVGLVAEIILYVFGIKLF